MSRKIINKVLVCSVASTIPAITKTKQKGRQRHSHVLLSIQNKTPYSAKIPGGKVFHREFFRFQIIVQAKENQKLH